MNALVYELLLRLLFVLHAGCAAFVAGGTAWLTLRGLSGLLTRSAPDRDDPLEVALRDWLPFVLGLAITFGVGPLLFVQLLDGEAFYTANLLLSHRFMALLPALIVGFYLLYVQKTEWRLVRSRLGRLLVPGLAFACFGFTAWSFGENHLLAQSRAAWTTVYAAGPGFFAHPDLVARMTVFAGIAAQAAAVGLALLAPGRVAPRRLGVAVGVGVGLTLLGFGIHPPVAGVTAISSGTGGIALGVELLLLGAFVAAARHDRSPRWLSAVALLIVIERIAAIREAVRLARGGQDAFAETASAQGFALFAATLVGVVLAIAWVVRRVARDLRAV